MKAYKIEINGYKRLAKVTCNIDGKMIAFVGQNEAGKSSLLEALSWHSTDSEPLPARFATRSQATDPEIPTVMVHYALEEEDREVLEDLALDKLPTSFVLAKYQDGRIGTGVSPWVGRSPQPFNDAIEALREIESVFPAEFEAYDRSLNDDEVIELIGEARRRLEDRDVSWDAEWDSRFDELLDWLREPVRVDGVSDPVPRSPDTAERLVQARTILRASHPGDIARQRLRSRTPAFVLFAEDDRTLASTYDLADEGLRAAPPSSLENLAWLAGLDIEGLWSEMEAGDSSRARTRERRANEQLKLQLGPRWRQEQIDVELRINGTALEVLIVEGHSHGETTPIEERSDGLRVFVALTAFLARKKFELPPILLVDELETHLHLDAQADLVEVLTKDVEASQVLYTTHSPGCLPRDLGTGIRLVTPDETNRSVSRLRNDFWTSGVGFSPLLFAMGASAAAFSALRKAVFCEGPSDMILLPSLFRIALGLEDIEFQVAHGLAQINGSVDDLELAAAKVVYLLDGDEGGTEHRERLVDLGLDADRVLQLGAGRAAEDYVDQSFYLDAVDELMQGGSAPRFEDGIPDGTPIAKAVQDWCKANNLKAPGKVAVASSLVREPHRLRLNEAAIEELRDTYSRLVAALGS